MNIGALKQMLAEGQDNLLLRFGLGKALLDANMASEAIEHFQQALIFDPHHSASWKMLGKAYANCGRLEDAITTYTHGIAMAEQKGDIQAAKEMKVFLKRAESTQSTLSAIKKPE
jgi:Flp pilus assembly protein TadD